jgi:hypothetical protein
MNGNSTETPPSDLDRHVNRLRYTAILRTLTAADNSIKEGDYAVLTVSDTGMGIPYEPLFTLLPE